MIKISSGLDQVSDGSYKWTKINGLYVLVISAGPSSSSHRLVIENFSDREVKVPLTMDDHSPYVKHEVTKTIDTIFGIDRRIGDDTYHRVFESGFLDGEYG